MEKWGATEFGNGFDSFHGRNRDTLARAAEKLAIRPGKSFSAALGSGLRQSAAAIFAKKQELTQQMLGGHYHATIDRAKTALADGATGLLIAVQDTTYYNLSSHKGMEGLGTIQGNVKGVLQHNLLATTDNGLPLGLLYSHCWTREGSGAEELEATESRKWNMGLCAATEALSKINEGALNRAKMLLVQDREADDYGFIGAYQKDDENEGGGGVELLVRLHQRRNYELEGKGTLPLALCREQLSPAGEKKVTIFRDGSRITLTLKLSEGRVSMHKSKQRKELEKKEQRQSTAACVEGLWMIEAREVGAVDEKGNDVFKAEGAANWLLLTTLDRDGGYSAADVVGFYSLRWRVEQFHYVLKSGALNMERRQFDDVETFINSLALYSIIGWRLLYLSYAMRADPDGDATKFFDREELSILQCSSKRGEKITTNRGAVIAVGKLAGFAPSKKQPYPGLKLLASGLEHLDILKRGLLMANEISRQD